MQFLWEFLKVDEISLFLQNALGRNWDRDSLDRISRWRCGVRPSSSARSDPGNGRWLVTKTCISFTAQRINTLGDESSMLVSILSTMFQVTVCSIYFCHCFAHIVLLGFLRRLFCQKIIRYERSTCRCSL